MFLTTPRAPPRRLQRSLEQRGGNGDHDGGRHRQIQQVGADGREARILQQNRLEAVHRVREGIDIGDSAKPRRKRLNGIDGAAGENSSVFRIPNMARGTRGSSTRTISRNIMVLKANEVAT